MATTKKKPAPKKTVVARTTVKKTAAVRRHTKKSAKPAEHRSFAVSRENTPFLTFKPSVQSLYWLIVGICSVALVAWVMYLTVKVQNIYDQIEINNSAVNAQLEAPVKKTP